MVALMINYRIKLTNKYNQFQFKCKEEKKRFQKELVSFLANKTTRKKCLIDIPQKLYGRGTIVLKSNTFSNHNFFPFQHEFIIETYHHNITRHKILRFQKETNSPYFPAILNPFLPYPSLRRSFGCRME